MKDWGVPMCGLKPAATMHKIMMQSFATLILHLVAAGFSPRCPK
jgi:hypothetical protein